MQLPPINTLTTPRLSEAISDMRQRIAKASEEAVTGRYTDLTVQLDGQVGRAMLGQKAVDDIAQQRSILRLRESRMDLVQRNLSIIQETSSGLGARLQASIGLNDQAGQALATRDAKAALEQVFSSLNTRFGERFLFSGDATDTRPFPDAETLLAALRPVALAATDAATFESGIDSFFNDPSGTWQQGIYAGTPTASDPDATIGIDPAITRLVAGLATAALARPEEGIALLSANSLILQSAASRILSGETAVTNLRSDRGVIQQQIDRSLASLDIEETILTRTFNELTARDQYEAASELRELEANLEASYLLTSRLSNLTLLNFLR